MTRLSQTNIREQLDRLPEWAEVGGELQRTYRFEDFVAAMRFVNAVAVAAEARDHHPDILIRYNMVTLSISTHDVGDGDETGGITEKDFDLIRQIDAYADTP